MAVLVSVASVAITGCGLFGPSFSEASEAADRVHDTAVTSIEGVIGEPSVTVERSVDGFSCRGLDGQADDVSLRLRSQWDVGTYDSELFDQLIDASNQAVAQDPAGPDTTEHALGAVGMAATHRSGLYVVHVTTPGEDHALMIVGVETISRCAPPPAAISTNTG